MIAKSVYIGHGAPYNAIWNNEYSHNLAKFGEENKPKGIVVISAHWQSYVPVQITSSDKPGIIYDYYGFPEEMYKIQYDFHGDPLLAENVASKLKDINLDAHLNHSQGIDHGAWVPLKKMYPKGDIPIIQVSIPVPRDPEVLFRIGEALRPLREESIMLLGSGNITHNLPHVFKRMEQGHFDTDNWAKTKVEEWAEETDEYIKNLLDNSNFEKLLRAPSIVPNFKQAAPTTEHFDPLYFTLGSMEKNEVVSYINEGFEAGSISMRCIQSEH